MLFYFEGNRERQFKLDERNADQIAYSVIFSEVNDINVPKDFRVGIKKHFELERESIKELEEAVLIAYGEAITSGKYELEAVEKVIDLYDFLDTEDNNKRLFVEAS
ncbi:MAG: hypothetical protein N4A47_03520 [Clostridia bacterium]|jgi:hypothetical protein|nr:hypothetical protein [Clostridia bacterium]